jgi:hypothetical protein
VVLTGAWQEDIMLYHNLKRSLIRWVCDCLERIQDHMVRDINAGRFSSDTSLVLLTHGLSLRIFLMRWFHWTVDEFLNVFNPPNAVPLVPPYALLTGCGAIVYEQSLLSTWFR